MSPDVFINTYQAGLVKRHHVNPSDAVQTVGAHSWGVAMILQYIYPECSKALLLAALRHDVAERWLGDTPAQVKWNHPSIANAINDAETRVETLLGYDHDFEVVEHRALKVADMLDLYLFSKHRAHMGDRYFEDVIQNVLIWANDHLEIVNSIPKAKELFYVGIPLRAHA